MSLDMEKEQIEKKHSFYTISACGFAGVWFLIMLVLIVEGLLDMYENTYANSSFLLRCSQLLLMPFLPLAGFLLSVLGLFQKNRKKGLAFIVFVGA